MKQNSFFCEKLIHIAICRRDGAVKMFYMISEAWRVMIESKSDVKSINRDFQWRCIKAWKLYPSFSLHELIFNCTLSRDFNLKRREEIPQCEGFKGNLLCVL